MPDVLTEKKGRVKIVKTPVALHVDQDGVIRIAGTRVTFDVVIAAFQQGATAEEIFYMFPGLELADIYAVISYYLKRQEELDLYLRQRQARADHVRQQNERRFETQGIRNRLLARRAQSA
jgi:uncharacterized protein (DUF433 family)